MATQPDEFADHEPPTASQPAPPLVSGKLIVSIVAAIGVIGAASAWLYHYDQKRVPREFWGFESPRIFLEAEKVTALLIKPEDVGAVEKPQFYDDLYMIDALRYTVVKKTDITKRDDLQAVREMIRDYHNLDSGYKLWKQPEWRFGLIFENQDPKSGAHYTASIVFDSECKLGKPQSVDKTISTARMSDELLAFFEKVFPEAKTMKTSAPLATHSFTQPLAAPAPSPSATPSATGGIMPPVDADVMTLPTPKPSATTGAVTVPGPSSAAPTGPSILGKGGPVVMPNAPLPQVLGGLPQVQQNFGLPGATPGAPAAPIGAGNIQLPGGLLPQNPAGAGSPGMIPKSPLDLSIPTGGVTVPPIGGAGT